MDESEVIEFIGGLAKKLPKFKDGRINYSDSIMAPIVLVFVKYKGKFLLLKRSKKVLHYQGMWNVVSGYMDELKPIRKKALEEIEEELGITEAIINTMTVGDAYTYTDKEIDRTWLVCPVMVGLSKKPSIRLDHENCEYRWISPAEIDEFETPPDLKKTLAKFVE